MNLGRQFKLDVNSIHVRARAERLYQESLRDLLRIYRQLMLGKEMRLYAKIKLELAQSAGLPFRWEGASKSSSTFLKNFCRLFFIQLEPPSTCHIISEPSKAC